MVSPYYCYALAFAMGILMYPLGWSDLYPSLSWSLMLFVLATIALHVFSGLRFSKSMGSPFTPIGSSPTPGIWVTCILYLLWSAEFIYEGGIPLFMILFRIPYDYRLFGIPSLHVFIVTFSSFFTIFLFHQYLSSRNRLILFLFALNLFAAILIYSRAMFFFNASACFLMVITRVRRIPPPAWFGIAAGMVLLFYVFGAMGTLRVSRESSMNYNNELFLEIGKASQSFRESSVPKEYFWTYIYATSPLANLQTNIDNYPVRPLTFQKAAEMVNNEIVMDFISKRVNALTGTYRESERTVEGPFNVSTVYSRSFSYAGWYGMILMALVVLLLPVLYMKIIPAQSPFFLTGFATLCTMFLFLAYDNTIRLTGLSFQLVYPVLLHFGCKRLPLLRKIFL